MWIRRPIWVFDANYMDIPLTLMKNNNWPIKFGDYPKTPVPLTISRHMDNHYNSARRRNNDHHKSPRMKQLFSPRSFLGSPRWSDVSSDVSQPPINNDTDRSNAHNAPFMAPAETNCTISSSASPHKSNEHNAPIMTPAETNFTFSSVARPHSSPKKQAPFKGGLLERRTSQKDNDRNHAATREKQGRQSARMQGEKVGRLQTISKKRFQAIEHEPTVDNIEEEEDADADSEWNTTGGISLGSNMNAVDEIIENLRTDEAFENLPKPNYLSQSDSSEHDDNTSFVSASASGSGFGSGSL
jgi:hypothetical protein